MTRSDGWSARLGPVLRTAAAAAVAFAILWALAPHLTVARSSERSTVTTVAATDGHSQTTTVTTVAATTSTAPVVPRVASGTALRRETSSWDDRGQAFVDDPGWPESLAATHDLGFAVYPAVDDKDGVIFDRSTVGWTIEVTNQSNERLWGLFVYLELAGRATCDERVLDPGQMATCWVEDIAFLGPQTADVWATAWDIDDTMSADRILQPYVVVSKPSH